MYKQMKKPLENIVGKISKPVAQKKEYGKQRKQQKTVNASSYIKYVFIVRFFYFFECEA